MSSIFGEQFDSVKWSAVFVGLVLTLGCITPSNESARRSQTNANPPSPSVSTESIQQSEDEVNALRLVSAAIESNKLNVTANDLKAKKNPKGDGIFVYVPQTRYSGVERYVIWMIIDSKAYALNSPSKMVTPSLPWPRDADEATWNKTGIDKYNGAAEAIEIVFGK